MCKLNVSRNSLRGPLTLKFSVTPNINEMQTKSMHDFLLDPYYSSPVSREPPLVLACLKVTFSRTLRQLNKKKSKKLTGKRQNLLPKEDPGQVHRLAPKPGTHSKQVLIPDNHGFPENNLSWWVALNTGLGLPGWHQNPEQ